jgi:hypothetical protein
MWSREPIACADQYDTTTTTSVALARLFPGIGLAIVRVVRAQRSLAFRLE